VSPTRLALALSGGPSSEVQQEVAEGYVIVETNYRVCPILQRMLVTFSLPLSPAATAALTSIGDACIYAAMQLKSGVRSPCNILLPCTYL